MTDPGARMSARRSARAILIDGEDKLLLIKRTRPGLEPYWTCPGGAIEPTDASAETAMRRELAEELGAEAGTVAHVFLCSSTTAEGQRSVQLFFTVRLTALEESARTGTEFDDPSRGSYALDRISLRGDHLASVDLKPAAVKSFILANRGALPALSAAGPDRMRRPH